ncbi:histidine kinase [Alsobacter metallidurans]|uniref:Histidine kinase n=1 Tax=Alsobacter metallidurans TaxID=340221 RepID=A0A917MKJ1_9HYPH|nr:CBS domain-containing protein [Alsobacter metallidurans]GGH33195.1 histidine kinase [Alsobacter metallidurans]
MKAKDVMSFGVVSVRDTAPLADAVRAMLAHRVSGLPVTDAGGSLVGMISEGDLLRRSELATEPHRPKWLEFLLGPGRMSAEFAQTHGRVVCEVMTTDVVSADEDTDLSAIVQLMEKNRIKRIPVLRNGQLVGIVSRADLLRALDAILARGKVAAPASDAEIRSALLAAFEAQGWAPKATIRPSVTNGAVTLSGCIFDDRERDGLRVLAENVPGVTTVNDEMVTIVPFSDAFAPPGP